MYICIYEIKTYLEYAGVNMFITFPFQDIIMKKLTKLLKNML